MPIIGTFSGVVIDKMLASNGLTYGSKFEFISEDTITYS